MINSKKYRTKIIKLSGLVVFFNLAVLLNTAHAESCTSSTTLSGLIDSTGQNECTVTPDNVNFDVYQFGICTSDPTYSDLDSCDFILNQLAPVEFNLGSGDTGTLTGATLNNIGAKNYTHTFITLKNSVNLTTQFTFDTDQQGYDGTYGPVCWTNGQSDGFKTDTPTDNSITCGLLSAADPTETPYNYNYLGASGTYTTSLTTTEGNTNDYTITQGLAPSSIATTDTDGVYIFTKQALGTALDLTSVDLPNYNIDISFLVTDAAKMVFNTGEYCHTSKDVSEGGCLGNIEVEAIDVVITGRE